MFGTIDYCFANIKPSLAVVAFTNKSGDANAAIVKVLEKKLLSELVRCKNFEMRVKYPVKETIEIENKLSVTSNEYKNAVLTDDFDKVIYLTDKDLSSKKSNDYIPCEITNKIGRIHGVNYLFHADINYVGNGLHSMALEYQNNSYAHTIPYIEVRSACRLIRVTDGKIIWHTVQFASGKNLKLNLDSEKVGGVAIENMAENEGLYLECTDKITTKIIKQLTDDFNNNRINF